MIYKSVVLDVDGTIIAPGMPGGEGLSPRLIDTVKQVQAIGIPVSLATARSLDWVQDILDILKLSGPIILDNGARIWDTHHKRYIHESYLPVDTARQVMKFLQQFPYRVHLVDHDIRLTYNHASPPPLTQTAKIMVLHMSPSDTEHLYQKLQRVPNIQITKSISGENPVRESIHVTSHDATKDGALRKLVEHLEIDLGSVIGMGDSYNDISFLSICGLKIAMGNAIPEVKELADYITDTLQEDGVAKALEKFILKKSQ